MTLQQKLQRVSSALVSGLTVTDEGATTSHLVCPIYHYWRPNMSAPFVVWAEDGEQSPAANADDRKAEQALTGYVDYYTKTEYDTTMDLIQDALLSLQGDISFGWRLDTVLYEDDTNLIHYQWTWVI